MPRIWSLVSFRPSIDTATFVMGESLISLWSFLISSPFVCRMMRLKEDVLAAFNTREQVLPQERLASGEAHGGNACAGNLIHQIDGAVGVEVILPTRLPVVTTNTFGLTILS